MADLFVRGGLVIDGTGAPASEANVRVRNGLVVEVAEGIEPAGEEVLDADGAFVTPGFIDVHTHYDGAMWWDRNLSPSPQHGVTTVVTGNSARSPSLPSTIAIAPRWSTCSATSRTFQCQRWLARCPGRGRRGRSFGERSILMAQAATSPRWSAITTFACRFLARSRSIGRPRQTNGLRLLTSSLTAWRRGPSGSR